MQAILGLFIIFVALAAIAAAVQYAWAIAAASGGYLVFRVWQAGRLVAAGGPLPVARPARGAEEGEELPRYAAPPQPPKRGLDEVLRDLYAMRGLDQVKAEVQKLVDVERINTDRRRQGMPVPTISRHMIFSGPPGTGKTTIARAIAEAYHCLGITKSSAVVECDRGDLVASYVGQTAPKVKKKIAEAIGGILFIDEAYTLASGDEFGQEAIDTLLKEMEDKRDQLVVIIAGYESRMTDFIESNPGLKSRFTKTIKFSSYAADDLTAIMSERAESSGYVLEEGAKAAIREHWLKATLLADENFGNARDARSLLEKIIEAQSGRLATLAARSADDLKTLTQADAEVAING
jgi:SpoVK/Ycf46/Vps4 family AAA+-type ATPase